jgi:aspartate/methionine/tyrosine aminotransferase
MLAADGFFERQAGRFSWLRPQAGSVAFPYWQGSSDALSQRLLDKEGVMLLPGSMFDASEGYFRLGLARLNFPEALDRLERVVSDW